MINITVLELEIFFLQQAGHPRGEPNSSMLNPLVLTNGF